MATIYVKADNADMSKSDISAFIDCKYKKLFYYLTPVRVSHHICSPQVLSTTLAAAAFTLSSL